MMWWGPALFIVLLAPADRIVSAYRSIVAWGSIAGVVTGMIIGFGRSRTRGRVWRPIVALLAIGILVVVLAYAPLLGTIGAVPLLVIVGLWAGDYLPRVRERNLFVNYLLSVGTIAGLAWIVGFLATLGALGAGETLRPSLGEIVGIGATEAPATVLGSCSLEAGRTVGDVLLATLPLILGILLVEREWGQAAVRQER